MTRDPKQDEFMARDVCLLVDAEDRVVGTATKEQTHREALLHRAFSVLLFDPDSGRLLLQRRSQYKVTFPLLWANTCCSHPLDSVLENTTDSVLGVKRAAVRKLEHELGMVPEQLPLDGFVHVVRFAYCAHDKPYSENESLLLSVAFLFCWAFFSLFVVSTVDYVLVFVGHVDVHVNKNEVDAVQWVDQDALKKMLQNGLLSLFDFIGVLL